jgi:hypothetical protein
MTYYQPPGENVGSAIRGRYNCRLMIIVRIAWSLSRSRARQQHLQQGPTSVQRRTIVDGVLTYWWSAARMALLSPESPRSVAATALIERDDLVAARQRTSSGCARWNRHSSIWTFTPRPPVANGRRFCASRTPLNPCPSLYPLPEVTQQQVVLGTGMLLYDALTATQSGDTRSAAANRSNPLPVPT